MIKETESNYIFTVSDKTLNAVTKIFCGLSVCVLTLGFFGDIQAGAKDDIALQIDRIPKVSEVAGASRVRTNARGLSRRSYSERKEKIESNTFVISQTTSGEGIPDEMVAVEEFLADGSKVWVSCTKANVRKDPTVASEKAGEIAYGDRIIRLSYGSNWSKIKTPDGVEGFVLSSLLSDSEILKPTPTPMPTATPVPTATPAPTASPVPQKQETQEQQQEQQQTQTNTSSVTESELYLKVYASCAVNLRKGPDTDAECVRVLNSGDEIDVVAQTSNGWYRTAPGNYVKASLCTDTPPVLPSQQQQQEQSSEPQQQDQPQEQQQQQAAPVGSNDFATYCLQYVGCPYVYAGASPSGFDCSGFASYVYANYYGISLPHSADSISQLGYAVSSDEMIPGDVICNDHNGDGYIDHVSVYIGDGTVVHASTSTTGVITSNFGDLKDVTSIRRLR